MDADAAALKRANKLLVAEMRRRSIETDAETLGHKKLASNLEAELKRLRIEMTRKDGELRRHERALEAHESAALFGGGGGSAGGLPGGGAEQKSLVKALKVQVRELQAELRTKQASIDEMSGSAKNARFKELEVRCRMSEQELSRQKEISRALTVDREEMKVALEEANAAERVQNQMKLQALSGERATLKQQTAALDAELGRWMDENDQLRAMVVKLEQRLQTQPARDKENIERNRRELKEIKDRLKGYEQEKAQAESTRKRLVQDCNELVQSEQAKASREQAKATKAREKKDVAFHKMTRLQLEVDQLRGREGGAPGGAGKATAFAAGAGVGKAPSSPAKAAPVAPRPGTKASEP